MTMGINLGLIVHAHYLIGTLQESYVNYFFLKPSCPKVFSQFEIIMNVLVTSFYFIRIPTICMTGENGPRA